MAWAVAADIYNQFPQEFVDELTGGDDDVLTALIDASDSQAAAKIKKRYPSQVTNRTSSTTMMTIVTMMTIRKLYNRNPLIEIPKNIPDDIEFSINLLSEIAEGKSDVPEWTRPNGMMTGDMKFESQKTFQDWVNERDELDA